MNKKECKGINKAFGYDGCGKLSDYRKFGLCPYCLYDWMTNSENGKIYYLKQFKPKVNNQTKQVEERIILKTKIEVLFEGIDLNIFKPLEAKEITDIDLKEIKSALGFLQWSDRVQNLMRDIDLLRHSKIDSNYEITYDDFQFLRNLNEEYGYYEGIIDWLKNYDCRQIIFWTDKEPFVLSFDVEHTWNKQCGTYATTESIFEINSKSKPKTYSYQKIKNSN